MREVSREGGARRLPPPASEAAAAAWPGDWGGPAPAPAGRSRSAHKAFGPQTMQHRHSMAQNRTAQNSAAERGG